MKVMITRKVMTITIITCGRKEEQEGVELFSYDVACINGELRCRTPRWRERLAIRRKRRWF